MSGAPLAVQSSLQACVWLCCEFIPGHTCSSVHRCKGGRRCVELRASGGSSNASVRIFSLCTSLWRCSTARAGAGR